MRDESFDYVMMNHPDEVVVEHVLPLRRAGWPTLPAPADALPDSLKSFIAANTMLLAAMGAMTGLATFVGRGSGPGWSATLLQFVLTGFGCSPSGWSC